MERLVMSSLFTLIGILQVTGTVGIDHPTALAPVRTCEHNQTCIEKGCSEPQLDAVGCPKPGCPCATVDITSNPFTSECEFASNCDLFIIFCGGSFQTDAAGCPLQGCPCASLIAPPTLPGCAPSGAECRKDCGNENNWIRDASGCATCRCLSDCSPDVSQCSKEDCETLLTEPNRRRVDILGCPCACQEPTTPTTTTTTEASTPSKILALSRRFSPVALRFQRPTAPSQTRAPNSDNEDELPIVLPISSDGCPVYYPRLLCKGRCRRCKADSDCNNDETCCRFTRRGRRLLSGRCVGPAQLSSSLQIFYK